MKMAADATLSGLELVPDTCVDVEAMATFRLGWQQIQSEFSSEDLLILHQLVYKDKTRTEMAAKLHMTPAAYSKRAKEVKRKAVQILVGLPDEKG